MAENNTLIKDTILKVKYEINIAWLSVDIQESISNEDYEKVAEHSKELSKQSKALLKLIQKYEGCKVAEELYTLISKRNAHMVDRLNVTVIKKKYGYVFEN